MKKPQRSLAMIALIAAAQPFAWCLQATPTAAELEKEIRVMSDLSGGERYQTEQDYIFALSKENSTAETKLKSSIDLIAWLSKTAYFPLTLTDVSPLLQDFHPKTAADLLLLHRFLMSFRLDPSPLSAPLLNRMGLEILQIPVTHPAEIETKIRTLCLLASVLRNQEYGKQFDISTLECLVNAPVDEVNKIEPSQIDSFLSIYIAESPPTNSDGERFAQALKYVLKLSAQRPSTEIPWQDNLFRELAKRCDARQAAELQQLIVNTAVEKKVDGAKLGLLRTQLAYTYLLANDPDRAETALRQTQEDVTSMSLLGQLLLAECLRRQRKIDDSNAVLKQIETAPGSTNVQSSFDVYDPIVFMAAAHTIRAQNAVDQNNFQLALKHFQIAETGYSRNGSGMTTIDIKYPRLDRIVPLLHMVQAKQISILKKLNRLKEAEQEEQKMIAADKADAENKKWREDNDLSYKKRVADEAALRTEELDTAVQMLEVDQDKKQVDDPKFKKAELATISSLIQGDYDKCETESRLLANQLVTLDNTKPSPTSELSRTARDQFLWRYQVGILARAQALAQQNSFDAALVLLREIIRAGASTDVTTNAYAWMARCYQQTNHLGLAATAKQHATSSINNASQPRLTADAELQLARLAQTEGKTLRAQRYLSEALQSAQRGHLENTALFREIKQASGS